MSPPIRVGFVGLSTSGWASMALGPAMFSIKDKYHLVALSTSSESSASAAAEKYSKLMGHQVKSYFGSTDKISNDPDVDLVVVSVKAPHHYELLLPAIEAKKAVFIEWPVGCNLTQTVELAEKAAKHGIRSMVGLQAWQSPVVRKVKDLIDSGKIGKVLSTTYVALAPREQKLWPPNVRASGTFTVDPSHGATMVDIALGHQIAGVTFALGGFASVTAVQQQHYPVATLMDDATGKPTGQTLPSTTPDHCAFVGLLRSGAVASVIMRGGQTSVPGRRQLLWEIDGEIGTIHVQGDGVGAAWINIVDPSISLNGERIEVPSGGVIGNLTSAWKEFALGRCGTYATLEDAVEIHQLLEGIRTSAKEGRAVQL